MYKTLQSLINTSNYDVFLDLFPILSKLKDNSTRDTIPNAKILGMLNKWNMIFPNEVHDVEYLVNDLTLKHNFLVE